jgi:mannosyl-oligosaccharide alpha-1,2-mannosidase
MISAESSCCSGGRKEQWLRDMYNRGMDGVMNHILATSSKTGLLFLGDWNGRTLGRKMDHLACFLPGTLALGVCFSSLFEV